MSKIALKKELALMTKPQLEQLVLEAYSARKEIKEYLEYFLAPDPDKLLDKAREEVEKECRRGKWGRSKTRVSVLRKIISDFASFQPGDDYVLRLRFFVIFSLLSASASQRMSDTLVRGFSRFVDEYVAAADTAGCISHALDALQKLADGTLGTRSFRALILRR
ncbi:MAG: hypothetical protein K2M06_08360 [Muribaculaceae bacterium]|nr:hypothetical protein [Muribaculaceae bacterium]